MSQALDDLRDQLTSWYMSLDPRTVSFLETMYSEAPAVVLAGIGGGAVSAEELGEHPTLASVLEVDLGGDASSMLPFIGAAGPLAVDPLDLTTSSELVVRWTDVNYGRATSSFADVLVVVNADGAAVHQVRTDPMALDAGGQVAVALTVPPLPAGDHTLRIVHNVDGVDRDQSQYANRRIGLLSYSELPLTVRWDDVGYTEPAGPHEYDGPITDAFGEDHDDELFPEEASGVTSPTAAVATGDAADAGDAARDPYVDLLPVERAEDESAETEFETYVESIPSASGPPSGGPTAHGFEDSTGEQESEQGS